ncbi:MAG: hypothetical protein IPP16_17120 [Acidimicrobiaceae bacterium]|nr:hypothetical protein [Acidimicrobiaceae bacterium]
MITWRSSAVASSGATAWWWAPTHGQASGGQVEVGVPVGCAAALSAQLALDAVTLARST